MIYHYEPEGVCSYMINFKLENGIIEDLEFEGGCDGNLKAIAKLVKGKDAQEIAEILEGNTCGSKMTSCADQLSKALYAALKEN